MSWPRRFPESVLDLLKLGGLGPKKAAVLWNELQIANLDDLKAAIGAGSLESLSGFGKKSIEKLQQSLEFLERCAGRNRLDVAMRVAETLCEQVSEFKGVSRVEYAGSLRRGKETAGDVDLLCIAEDGEGVIKAFTKIDGAVHVQGAGATKGSILYEHHSRETIQVDLRVVPAESFGAALQYFTGSKEHNVRLRERAQQRGWSLNEYGLTEGETVLASKSEEEIYAKLDLPCYPPELREDRGEFELEAVPEDLLAVADIRCDLHMHTTASDGKNSIEEMAEAAYALKRDMICITDHSQSSVIAGGLSPEQVEQQIEAVRKADAQIKGVAIWVGMEVDILAGGKLDYDDELLAQLDFVIASLHVHKGDDVKENTRRVLGAIENPYVNLIAHPTARLINQRVPMGLDIEAVIKAAAKTGTALEINSSPQRLDLRDTHARLARDNGVVISINTDAHRTVQLANSRYGVLTARRAGLLRDEVLNTWPIERIREFVDTKRSR
jgi:DNA polymerase (family 10)